MDRSIHIFYEDPEKKDSCTLITGSQKKEL